MRRKRFVVGAILAPCAAAVLVSAVSGSAGAALGIKCPKTRTPAGTVHYTATKPLRGGGTAYYFCINGIVNVVPEAPLGFRPLSATAAQLAEYGIPPRPSGRASFAQWKTDMAAFHPSKRVPALQVTNERATLPPGGGGAYTASGNWAGWMMNNSTNNWVAAEGNYNQPQYHSTSCSNAHEVSWTGIGGNTNNSGLIQDGTEITPSGGYSAWYEYLNSSGGGISITHFKQTVTIHPGDKIHTYVAYARSTGLTDFYVADDTTGTQGTAEATLGSSYYDGTTAEWIDERPTYTVNGVNYLYPLLNYGSTSWNTLQGENVNGSWILPGNHSSDTYLEMMNGNRVLSLPSSFATSTFNDFYYACN